MIAGSSESVAGAVVGRPATGRRRLAVWPTLLGVAAAAGVALTGDLATVVLVCAAIFLLAAVTDRPGSAWIGFAVSVPLIGLGRLFQAPWVPTAAVAAAAVALAALGAARGTWGRRENRRQLAAMLGFGVVVILAVTLGDSVATAVFVVAALLAHAAWDIWHHAARAVVARPYAEFCAALDLALAVTVVVTWLGPPFATGV